MKTPALLRLSCFVLGVQGCEMQSSLKLIQTNPLIGVEERFDHFALDANGHRLLVAVLVNNTLNLVGRKTPKFVFIYCRSKLFTRATQ